jgi:hypothetical protein
MHLSSLIGEGDLDGATGLDRSPLKAKISQKIHRKHRSVKLEIKRK